MMAFDDLLAQLGDFGRYQRWVYCAVCLPIVFVGIQIMSPVFTLAAPRHRCAVPGLLNDTYNIQDGNHGELVQAWIPVTVTGDAATFSKCFVYNNSTGGDWSGNQTEQVPCSRWVYDQSVFINTVITETDLVCSRTIYRAHATTALNVGSLFGYLCLGTLSDRFGRKRVYLLEIVLMAGSSIFLIWLPSIYMFIVTRAVIGLGFGVFYNTAFVYAMEFIGLSKRTVCGMFINNFWAVGLFLQAGMAYGLRQWRHLQLAMSVPFLAFLAYWWIVPKSPRWLMSRGHTTEAMTVLQRIARFNKVKLEFNKDTALTVSDKTEEVVEDKGIFYFFTLFRYRSLGIMTLIVFLNWLVVSCLYYGLSLNVGNLSGNLYVNFTLSAVMEVVAYNTAIPAMMRLGRKRFHCACMLTGGVALLLTVFPELYGNSSTQWIVVVLAMVGKLAASAAYATIILFSTELFPTVVRSSAMGFSAFFAGIGGLIAPYVVELANLLEGQLAQALPLLVFGISTSVAGVTALALPETGKSKLPDSIADTQEVRRYCQGNDKSQSNGTESNSTNLLP